MPSNPFEPPQEVNERSEILTPFLHAVGRFVLGTLVYAGLFTVALAMSLFLIGWALSP